MYGDARVGLSPRHRVVRYYLLHRRRGDDLRVGPLPIASGDYGGHHGGGVCENVLSVVGNAVNLFPDVKYSVGLTLIFVGLDMILDAFDIDLPAWALGVLMPVLFVIDIASSMIRGGGTSKDLSKIMGEGCDYTDRKVSNEESGRSRRLWKEVMMLTTTLKRKTRRFCNISCLKK